MASDTASVTNNSRAGKGKTDSYANDGAMSSSTSASPSAPSSPWPRQEATGTEVSGGVRRRKYLDADVFRHPLDLQNTRMLQTLPGLSTVFKSLMGPLAEQMLMLENISTSVKVGETQLPRLHRLLRDAANVLDIDCPSLYIRQNPQPNAYTLAISGQKPLIVVHTSLVELLTEEELQAVLAHELGHLKADHGVWLTAANVLALAGTSLPGVPSFVANNVEEALLRWLRAAELTCDRAALLVAKDPRVVISTLMKLAGGTPKLADQLNVESFLAQARSYDEARSSPMGWYLANAQSRQLSHPLPVARAKEIDEWAKSTEFQELQRRLNPMANKV